MKTSIKKIFYKPENAWFYVNLLDRQIFPARKRDELFPDYYEVFFAAGMVAENKLLCCKTARQLLRAIDEACKINFCGGIKCLLNGYLMPRPATINVSPRIHYVKIK